ncbi:hypothetical protein MNBD_ALPHA12-94 [hydrothermal vent metagenome]|uniref:Homoserine/homoserine lactone efflux protein n=1 Tax=hydrothermal vent metagenome TaxID=652676 RepID=A0A3B0TIQ9_9ZZZZ
MFDMTTLIAFSLACFALAAVPGPNVSVIIATGLQRGPLSGLAVVLGTQIGIFSQVIVVALGFDAIIGFMGWAFDWIKLFGAAYLVYLGFSMLRASGKLGNGKPMRQLSLFSLALRGFLINWSNPKTLLFIGAFIPQFVSIGQPAFPQIMLLGLIFVGATTLVDATYGFLSGSAGKALSTARIKTLSRVSGAILIAGGAWLALQRKT